MGPAPPGWQETVRNAARELLDVQIKSRRLGHQMELGETYRRSLRAGAGDTSPPVTPDRIGKRVIP